MTSDQANGPLWELVSTDDVTQADLIALAELLGRAPRGVRRIVARCENGWPAVVETEPRLVDGTPFPTFWYATCRRLTAAMSTLESEGVMRRMQEQLAHDPELAERYRQANWQYLQSRASVVVVEEIASISAGGMPTRVKCLHALAAHSLAVGPGINPFGDEALRMARERGLWPHSGRCVSEAT